jgi:hypothetical protein
MCHRHNIGLATKIVSDNSIDTSLLNHVENSRFALDMVHVSSCPVPSGSMGKRNEIRCAACLTIYPPARVL